MTSSDSNATAMEYEFQTNQLAHIANGLAEQHEPDFAVPDSECQKCQIVHVAEAFGDEIFSLSSNLDTVIEHQAKRNQIAQLLDRSANSTHIVVSKSISTKSE
mmetsp:Transcript_2894/g.9102  ORF Transcript_2894/g.9102 Transcript_2894/m.9102 type:complete len:103 (+) Transcript_2894:2838-3146(+)